MRLLALVLAGLLSGCAVTLEGLTLSYRLDFTPAILRFEPDRGPGAAYFVGEEVRFFLTLASPGWVSLVVVDPDGRTYTLDSFYLPRGTHVLPPGAYRYALTLPRGFHRVRAVYTDTEPGAVRLEGVYTDWEARLRLYLEASRAMRHQVAETYFYVY
ncbi:MULTISPECIES: DUF4384 domain-containing protein [Thermus]|jgi:hypothetical protein|nr:DUF4384 domain-containing protein [Thermus brockianus]APD09356.1 S-layer-like protein [Thermus brockianus]